MAARQFPLGIQHTVSGPYSHTPIVCANENSPNFAFSRTPTLASTPSTPTSPDRSAFMRRLFSRSSKSKPAVQAPPSTENAGYRNQRAYNPTAVIGPSPHTHPLLVRPRARDEKMMGSLGASQTRPSTAVSHFSQAESRSASRIAMASIPETADTKSLPDPPVSERFSDDEDEDEDLSELIVGHREQIALDCASGKKYVQEWNFFLRCYAEGRFNTSNPPDSPPAHTSFKYLQAPYPPNEGDRLEAVGLININFPDYAIQKMRYTLKLAMQIFQTRCATISLFERDCETVRAANGTKCFTMPRKHSIGSHVLLSSEPMVVLDTMKDWRFKENPTVQGGSCTRFYAGCPLVTSQGHIVGVFAVFDPRPKYEFGFSERRRLPDFAKYAMTDIEILVEELFAEPKDSEHLVSAKVSDTPFDNEPDARSRRHLKNLRIIEEAAESSGELTEPTDDFVSAGPTMVGEQTPPMSDSEAIIESYNRSSTVSFTKPKDDRSSKALSSLPTPPETPARPFSTGSKVSHVSKGIDTTPAYSRVTSLQADLTKNLSFAEKGVPDEPTFGNSLGIAILEAKLLAVRTGFDALYLIRVWQKPDEEGIIQETTSLILATGLPEASPNFDANLHLLALRSAGGLQYVDSNRSDDVNEEVGFKFGILLPYIRDNQEPSRLSGSIVETDAECNSGVVLAAYQKDAIPDSKAGTEKINFLRSQTKEMRDIFMKADQQHMMI
ncbi:MAG: hypothetical protein M1814_005729 [Vezdaea aestivalis]|nr:MAG: hypothetical protein M1814_005729 [Vezdaea aestivalis]